MTSVQSETATAGTVAVEGQSREILPNVFIICNSTEVVNPEGARRYRDEWVAEAQALSDILTACRAEGWAMCQRCGCVTIDPEQFAREGCCKCHCRERLQ